MFVNRWKINALSERSGSQSHFIDLCDMLGQPHPAAADAIGERYTFEKPVSKVYGGKGSADVWLRDHFAWEYKGKHKDLNAAYKQLNDYREELGNPPLLVVCDMDRFKVHTNFTNTRPRVYSFNLDDLKLNQVTATCPLPPLDVLRALFGDYNVLRPDRTDAFVTQEAAKLFAKLAERLEIEKRVHTDSPQATKQQIAHFLMRILFCLFADSVDLLPDRVFRRLIEIDRFYPRRFLNKLPNLFTAMSLPDGIFGEHTIRYFNGGLFRPDDITIIQLDKQDMAILYDVAHNYDWSHVAPAIFGTLFERSLNEARRSLIGAHYTSEEDILLLIEPVVMRPLQQRWAHVRDSILVSLGLPTDTSSEVVISAPATEVVILTLSEQSESKGQNLSRSPLAPTARNIIAQGETGVHGQLAGGGGEALGGDTATKPRAEGPRYKSKSLLTSNPEAERLLAAWFDSLASVRILDPACGSGNFLYVALRRLLDLWKEARDFAIHHNIQLAMQYAVEKMVSPSQLFGIETEFYAHELASIVVWIGFLQWKHEHGISEDREPILQKLDNIQHADAIMRYDDEGKPYEPAWPAADFIIGNPPFVGGNRIRAELSDQYVDDLFKLYNGRVEPFSDLVGYWFEKARACIEAGTTRRAGLLATQGIRGGANREVLNRIKRSGDIFYAQSDRKWPIDSAVVRVSMVGFDSGEETQRTLDGKEVESIHSNLTSGTNTTTAAHLTENDGICFMGVSPKGAFDIEAEVARKMLRAPQNVNGRPNSDVVKRVLSGIDIVGSTRNMWTIDFGTEATEAEAAKYELPFEYVRHHVYPVRQTNNRESYRTKWWLFAEPRPAMRKALAQKHRYIATPATAKHRAFVWIDPSVLCNQGTFAFARDDDYFFGVLHSTIHELWARAQGTQLREVESGFRYTPNSTFDTFPFPWPPGTEPSEKKDPRVKAIADAARELVRQRDAWLNPPNASEDDLKDRTLTKLYNLRAAGKCAWLENAHRALDEAVFAAYGWPSNLTTQQVLANLLALNHQRAAPANPTH